MKEIRFADETAGGCVCAKVQFGNPFKNGGFRGGHNALAKPS